MPRRPSPTLVPGSRPNQRIAIHIAGRAVVSARLLGRRAVRRAGIRFGPWIEIEGDDRPARELPVGDLAPRVVALLSGLAAEDRFWDDGATTYESVAAVANAVALIDEWIARRGWSISPEDAAALRAMSDSGLADRLARARKAALELYATSAVEAVTNDRAAIRYSARRMLQYSSLDPEDLDEGLRRYADPDDDD